MSLENKNYLLFPISLKKLFWDMVALLLIFLPFQIPIKKFLNLPNRFLWIDEIFVVFCFGLFLFMLLCIGRVKKNAVQILIPLLLLGIIGLISGLHNNNSLIITVNGIFDYIKNFLIIPFVCLFAISKKKFISLYKILHKLALFLCLIAVLQVILFYFKVDIPVIEVKSVDMRFGLPRVSSLIGHPNMLGLYSLLFFILDFSLHQRFRWQNLVLLIGIFLSVSRMVWFAFLISLFMLLLQIKSKKIFLFLIPGIITIVLVFPFFYTSTMEEWSSETKYRGYTRMKSLEIWKAHPLLGVGPGMYGGVVSVVFNSPIYERYDFSERWFNYGLKKFHSIDQFWPQILAEMGFLGVLGFGFLLFILWQIAKSVSSGAKDIFRKKMLSGLSVIPLVLVIYLIGSGLNLTPFLLTYSIFFGMILGMKNENTSN